MSWMGRLSQLLQKYYSKVGHKIIFANGMTLNKMAYEMWEKLGYREVDPSSLSRVLSGERLFTKKQIYTFARILHLSEHERNTLSEALLEEIAYKFDMRTTYAHIQTKTFIDSTYDTYQKIKQIRDNGLTLLAVQWSEQALSLIEEKTETLPLIVHNRQFLTLAAEAYVRHIHLLADILPGKALLANTNNYIAKARKYSVVLNDPVVNADLLWRQGSAYYVAGEHMNAAITLSKVPVNNNLFESSLLLYREMMLSLAYAGDIKAYTHLKKRIIPTIGEYPTSIQCDVYLGLARSESKLGNANSALKYLQKAEELLASNITDMRYIQYSSSELEYLVNTHDKSIIPHAKKVAMSALDLASKRGFIRHKTKIEKFLEDIEQL